MRKLILLLVLALGLPSMVVAARSGRYIILLKNPPSTKVSGQHAKRMNRYQKYRYVRKMLNFRYQYNLRPFVQDITSHTDPAIDQKRRKKYLPLVHGVSMQLTKAELNLAKSHPQVAKVMRDAPVYLDRPLPSRTGHPFSSFREAFVEEDKLSLGLKLHKVDKVIKRGVNIHTPGKIVGVIDTGIDGKHVEFKGKVVRFKNFANKSTDPKDTGSHGTHVSGIIAAGNKSGVQIGVYPGAKLVVGAALSGIADMLDALQWMLDPDGNPNTADQPFVINNSWHIGGTDPEPFYRALQAYKDADILVCFSAGNAGSRGLTKPKEFVHTFTTAAVDKNGVIANFSSWGPGKYKGKTLQKPEVASYGKDVMSTVPNGKYRQMSGTSMASPFTAGAIALLGSQFPKLSPYDIAKVLVKTADSKTDGKWDKKYGYGLVNVDKAYMMLKEMARR